MIACAPAPGSADAVAQPGELLGVSPDDARDVSLIHTERERDVVGAEGD
jgi:hypothetical protein